MFYVYVLYRNNDPLWRYVGKGCRNRMQESIQERQADYGLKVFRTSSEAESFRMEDCVWKGLTKRGFVLCNACRPGADGAPPNMSGSTHSEAVRLKISVGNRGKIVSEETREKLRQANLGKHSGRVVSSETRTRMSQRLLNRKMSEETKEKLRIANLGKPAPPLTPQGLEIIRQTSLGRIHSEETKEKLKQINLEKWRRKREQV